MRLLDALVRHARALKRGVKEWTPAAESPLPAEEIDALMRQAAVPSRGFFFMLILSTAIATFGLLSNSAPAIIGAMIIAPLMAPILGLAYGIVVVDGYQISHSVVTVVVGTAVVVLFAFLTTSLIGLRIAGSEILDRTSPTLLDLGIAMCAGAAGAYAYSRKSIANSIAGVAIAVALVPPLAVTGVGLAMNRRATADVGLSFSEIGLYSGGDGIAYGAFLLFLTNLAGIVVVAGMVLVFQPIRKMEAGGARSRDHRDRGDNADGSARAVTPPAVGEEPDPAHDGDPAGDAARPLRRDRTPRSGPRHLP